MNKLGSRSKGSMKGCNWRIGAVVGMVMARGKVDLTIICGLRTAEEQHAEFLKGASKLDGYDKKSYHQTGNAIDFIPYPMKGWEDTKGFRAVWDELEFCAKHLGFEVGKHISWDGGHFEIRG